MIFDAFGRLFHYDFLGDPHVLSCHAFFFFFFLLQGLPPSFRLVRWRRTANLRSTVVPLASFPVFAGLRSVDMIFISFGGLFLLLVWGLSLFVPRNRRMGLNWYGFIFSSTFENIAYCRKAFQGSQRKLWGKLLRTKPNLSLDCFGKSFTCFPEHGNLLHGIWIPCGGGIL